MAQATLPPLVAVLAHALPVVGGESPVLPLCGKGIGRCTGLAVEVEEACVLAGWHTVAADADGDVALEHHAQLARRFVNGLQLAVEQVLHESMEVALLLQLLILEVRSLCGPVAEIGRMVAVAQGAEVAVGWQPVGIVVAESLEAAGAFHLGTPFGEECAQELLFQLPNGFVVQFLAGVEGQTLGLVLLVGFAVALRARIEVEGMEGKDGDGAVGITVARSARSGRIVDGQNLHGTHARGGGPDDELLEVAKVAHAETALAAEREDGNHHARTAPSGIGPLHTGEMVGMNPSVGGRTELQFVQGHARHELMVGTFFPNQAVGLLLRHPHIFISGVGMQVLGGERQSPFVGVGAAEQAHLMLVPGSEVGRTTQHSPAIARGRGEGLEQEQGAVLQQFGARKGTAATAAGTVGQGTAREHTHVVIVHPSVAERGTMAAVGNEGAHKASLAAHAGSRLVADGILVVKTFGLVCQNKRSAPPKAVAGG